ncbi:hypothetical protein CERZMDRAFT_84470 [Cercospora zeae-maydis SCOH1-5]|uniref:Uncharacterized protein n=1 Tax=Cercospora zeae-maydis SCOH1-5 TaxID=717836 RepID=A0A6A6FHN2_9PEZI|nr:hypothetical protein CERZMDRAFT_84470 [Cercospora zeae-maydis SCOH1-5]
MSAATTNFFLASEAHPGSRKYMTSSPTNTSRSSSHNASIPEETAATPRKNQPLDSISETGSFISMDKFMNEQAPTSSRRKLVSSKLREWRSESHATWKRVQPYYEDFKYWVLMGPH